MDYTKQKSKSPYAQLLNREAKEHYLQNYYNNYCMIIYNYAMLTVCTRNIERHPWQWVVGDLCEWCLWCSCLWFSPSQLRGASVLCFRGCGRASLAMWLYSWGQLRNWLYKPQAFTPPVHRHLLLLQYVGQSNPEFVLLTFVSVCKLTVFFHCQPGAPLTSHMGPTASGVTVGIFPYWTSGPTCLPHGYLLLEPVVLPGTSIRTHSPSAWTIPHVHV